MWGGSKQAKKKLQKRTSRRMKQVAAQRRCPACKRGNALSAENAEGVRVCRYCGHRVEPKARRLCNLGVRA